MSLYLVADGRFVVARHRPGLGRPARRTIVPPLGRGAYQPIRKKIRSLGRSRTGATVGSVVKRALLVCAERRRSLGRSRPEARVGRVVRRAARPNARGRTGPPCRAAGAGLGNDSTVASRGKGIDRSRSSMVPRRIGGTVRTDRPTTTTARAKCHFRTRVVYEGDEIDEAALLTALIHAWRPVGCVEFVPRRRGTGGSPPHALAPLRLTRTGPGLTLAVVARALREEDAMT
jgi:hypothetical protein